MRGRKLLDQTLPLKVAGTLVSLLERFFESLLLCHTKVKVSKAHGILNLLHLAGTPPFRIWCPCERPNLPHANCNIVGEEKRYRPKAPV